VSRQFLSLTFALLTRGERHLLWYSANIRFLPFSLRAKIIGIPPSFDSPATSSKLARRP
jgi:hypothetical protein